MGSFGISAERPARGFVAGCVAQRLVLPSLRYSMWVGSGLKSF
jgi:hypothetical protein